MDIWGWLQSNRGHGTVEAAVGEIDGLFGPSRRHIHEYKEWVAVRREDDHESGTGPADLAGGRIELRKSSPDADSPDGM
jgi:hypothetical protein